jgi:ribonucleoside-diphosphate reductase alpha chain
MWTNREFYNGLSVLPFDGGSYIQAPFEDCTKEKYEELMKSLVNVDLSQIIEMDDNTTLTDQAACAGGACEIK